ncbi:hypothetical protein JXO52_07390 [bacterium]|nr:hypothetical protein [bacterium]
MPYTVHDQPEGPGVLIVLSGTVTGSDIYQLNETLMDHVSFSSWRYQIWDFCGIEKLETSFDDLRSFAMQDAKAAAVNPDQKVALVYPVTPPSGRDRLFHVLSEVWGGFSSRTFHSLDEAKQWVQ